MTKPRHFLYVFSFFALCNIHLARRASVDIAVAQYAAAESDRHLQFAEIPAATGVGQTQQQTRPLLSLPFNLAAWRTQPQQAELSPRHAMSPTQHGPGGWETPRELEWTPRELDSFGIHHGPGGWETPPGGHANGQRVGFHMGPANGGRQQAHQQARSAQNPALETLMSLMSTLDAFGCFPCARERQEAVDASPRGRARSPPRRQNASPFDPPRGGDDTPYMTPMNGPSTPRRIPMRGDTSPRATVTHNTPRRLESIDGVPPGSGSMPDFRGNWRMPPQIGSAFFDGSGSERQGVDWARENVPPLLLSIVGADYAAEMQKKLSERQRILHFADLQDRFFVSKKYEGVSWAKEQAGAAMGKYVAAQYEYTLPPRDSGEAFFSPTRNIRVHDRYPFSPSENQIPSSQAVPRSHQNYGSGFRSGPTGNEVHNSCIKWLRKEEAAEAGCKRCGLADTGKLVLAMQETAEGKFGYTFRYLVGGKMYAETFNPENHWTVVKMYDRIA